MIVHKIQETGTVEEKEKNIYIFGHTLALTLIKAPFCTTLYW